MVMDYRAARAAYEEQRETVALDYATETAEYTRNDHGEHPDAITFKRWLEGGYFRGEEEPPLDWQANPDPVTRDSPPGDQSDGER